MQFKSIKTLLLYAVLYIFSLGYADSLPELIPGTTISMLPPEGFTLSDSFSGFENLTTQSSILVIEMPLATYSDLAVIFSDLDVAKEGLAAQGIIITDSENIIIDKNSTPVFSGTQEASGVKVRKYMTLIENDPPVLITFNIFSPEEDLSTNEVFSALQSIMIGDKKTLEEKLDTLSFSFEAMKPFKTIDVLAGSAAILTTFDGTDTSGKLPLIAIASSMGTSVDGIDEKASARQFSLNIAGFENAEITQIKPIKFIGKNGYRSELVVDNRIAIHYVTFLDSGIYIRFIATSGQEEIKAVREIIDEIAMSVTLKE